MPVPSEALWVLLLPVVIALILLVAS